MLNSLFLSNILLKNHYRLLHSGFWLLYVVFFVSPASCSPGPVEIFLPGRQTSADMSFGFIYIQNLSGLSGQRRIDLCQSVRDILVHGGLGYAERLGRLPYCGIVINDIIGDRHRSLLNIIFQKNTP